MAKIEFKKEMKKNNTRWTQNGIIQMNEGNSQTFFGTIRKFNGSMDFNNIGVLRHKGKTLEKDCPKAALFQRNFSDGAHLTGKLYNDAFYEKNKKRSETKVGSRRWEILQGGCQNDLNMPITMNEFKQAMKKVKTNNKSVDPYGFHPKQ